MGTPDPRPTLPEVPGSDWWLETVTDGEARRTPVRGQVHVGRSAAMDVVLADPYVSRSHCTVTVEGERLLVDARGSSNHVRIGGREVESGHVEADGAFTVGRTVFRVLRGSPDEATLILDPRARRFALRQSTRELLDPDGSVVARFSTAEYAIVEALARRHPDAASNDELGRAVYGDMGYDQYLIHRLIQRVRQRAGDGTLIENVRGAGYRLTAAVDLR